MAEEARLAGLETRLRAVEDELAIMRLLSSYGPAVDSGSAAEAAAQWVDGRRLRVRADGRRRDAGRGAGRAGGAV
jgi:hypothetical protein